MNVSSVASSFAIQPQHSAAHVHRPHGEERVEGTKPDGDGDGDDAVRGVTAGGAGAGSSGSSAVGSLVNVTA